jgi:hypothetical protein
MKAIFYLTGAILLLAGTWSCNKDSDKSKLDIRLTDAPGPYSAVNVDIQGIEITGDFAEPIMLDVTPAIVNLLDFSNGKDTLIGTGSLEPGRVEQIRLILGPENTIVLNGETYDLSTPSAEQSGLKLQVHQTFEAGVEYSILLDFDARHSIVETGNGQFKLKPVIRTIDTAISGSIKGMIAPAGTLANVTAVSGDDSYSSPADANGNFLLKGLPSGTYTINIIHERPGSPYVQESIAVTVGNTTNLGTIDL